MPISGRTPTFRIEMFEKAREAIGVHASQSFGLYDEARAELDAADARISDLETALRDIADAIVPYPYNPEFLKEMARCVLEGDQDE